MTRHDDTYNGGAYMVDYSAYNKLYGATFPNTFPNWGVGQINDQAISFNLLHQIIVESDFNIDQLGQRASFNHHIIEGHHFQFLFAFV